MNRPGLRFSSQSLAVVWRQLTEPSDSIQDDEQRQQSRLLSSLLLILIALILVVLPAHHVIEQASSLGTSYPPLIILTTSYLILAYLLSRRGFYQLGSGLVVIAGSLTIFIAAILGGGSLGTLYYLICITLFSSLFFRVRFIIALSVIHVGMMLVFPVFLLQSTILDMLDGPITFHLVMTVIILLFSQYREHLESSRQKRLAESESHARTAESYFRMIFQHSPDAMMLLDPHQPGWPIIDCNDETCRLNGYTREELIGQEIDILHPAPTTDEAKADNLKLMRAKGIIEFEAIHRRKDGSVFTIHNSSAVINLHGRELILGTDRDITLRKLADQQQLDLKLERERMRILSNFIRDASHEFRTPLSIIKTNVYLLMKTPNASNQNRYISGITEQADGILRLVESLVMMARLDTDPGFRFTAVDLNQVLHVVVTSCQGKIDDAEVKLSFESLPDLPSINGDIDGLIEAFRHLLDNALRYTAPGGSIILRLSRDSTCAIFEIQDTGSGIAPKDLPHIFERFYRVDAARSTRGFGLGLSIVHKIIQEHHGQIEVESEPDKGSLFRVKLPLDRDSRLN